MMMEAKASVRRQARGSACRISPRSNSALFTSPTASLNMYLNWKPTRIGENIIGNIMMRAQRALAPGDPVDQQRQPEPEHHLEVERDGDEGEGAAERPPEVVIAEQPLVVPEARRTGTASPACVRL
jgi:hypothetical protein